MSEFKPVVLSLPSLTPSLSVEILPYGLTIHRIFVQVDGRTHDVVIGPEAPEDHLTQKYTNTIVGRYANRIPVGTHTLERHGVNSEFTAMANENPKVSLHGGPIGFDAKVWTLVTPESPSTLFSFTELSYLESHNTVSCAIFRLVSEDGDQGFPGKLVTEAFVALIAPTLQTQRTNDPSDEENLSYELGSILLIYRSNLDEKTKKFVTPVNLTQHWGFNLDASLRDGPESLSVKNHTLTIKADHIVELDPNSLATGSFLPISERPSHAHFQKKIGDQFPAGGYDDYYLFENVSGSIPTRVPWSQFRPELDLIKDIIRPSGQESEGPGIRANPVVELTSEKSGLTLTFDSNQRGVMFYSNGLASPAKGARKKIHGGSGIMGQGDAYGPGTAAFLEFHHPLTAFLDPKNKDGEDTLLTSDELYNNYVRCDVKFEVPRR